MATIIVSSGVTSSGIAVAAGDNLLVYGTASGTQVSSGGRENVFSSGLAAATTISSGGLEVVYQGGLASGTAILTGGLEYNYGSTTVETISGSELVYSGGVASGATLSGGTLEFASGGTASGTTIGFSAAGGTLQLDNSQSFTSGVGVISGLTATAGQIDLRDIAFDPVYTTLAFTEAGGNTSGTLAVSDGTHTATLTLLGQYVTANFHAAADGAGGTMITDPPVDVSSALSQPH